MTKGGRQTILVVDDETSIRDSFSLILQDDYDLLTAASGEAALKKLVDNKVDLIFLDIRMPGIDGIETLKRIKEIDDLVEVVMVTAVNDVQKAGEAVKIGANNYLLKPFDIEHILEITNSLIGKKKLKQETKNVRNNASEDAMCPELTGFSKEVARLRQQIEEASESAAPLLIFGEPGIEKDCLSAFIHSKSPRKTAPFAVMNAHRGLDQQLRQQLFGKGKGSFVDSLSKETGAIEDCDGGTILINNIENIDPETQSSLAAFISERKFNRDGSSDIHSDVRLIFSSCLQPDELASSRSFSHDLTEKLLASSIRIPPVRERLEDIPAIATAILEAAASASGKKIKGISPDALEVMASYDWPGNTAEMKSMIERAAVTTENDTLTLKDLPFSVLMKAHVFSSLERSKDISLSEMVSFFEKGLISNVIGKTGGDISKASQVLGINKNVLASKLDLLKID